MAYFLPKLSLTQPSREVLYRCCHSRGGATGIRKPSTNLGQEDRLESRERRGKAGGKEEQKKLGVDFMILQACLRERETV